MIKWYLFALCSLYILTVANCVDSGIGQSCRTQSGTLGTFQKPSSCPSLQNSFEDNNKNVTIVCCPHQTFTRSANVRKTSTKNTRQKSRNSANIPNLRVNGCGEGGPTELRRKPRTADYDDQDYRSTEDGLDDPGGDIDYSTLNMTTSMIVGGSQASPHAWPWMAGLVSKRAFSNRMQIFCGATLITNLHVISAAHCVVSGRRARTDFSVRLGGHTTTDGTTHSVRSTHVHPNYRNYYNDVSLIKLKEPVVYTNHIKPICLPSPTIATFTFQGKTAVVTGWGTVKAGGAQSSYLKQALVRVIPRAQCDNSYSRLYRKQKVITVNQICANNRGTDTCQGDSGGPLLLKDEFEKWTLIGITSFGQGCAQLQYPGIYTRVGAYLPWIKSILVTN